MLRFCTASLLCSYMHTKGAVISLLHFIHLYVNFFFSQNLFRPEKMNVKKESLGKNGLENMDLLTAQLNYIKNNILKTIFKHPNSWPFHKPVDVVQLDLPVRFCWNISCISMLHIHFIQLQISVFYAEKVHI